MENPKIFQIALTGIFIVLLVIGFLGFSGKIPLPVGKKDIKYGQVVLWGSIPFDMMQKLITERIGTQGAVTIKYVEKKSATFDKDFIEALASGNGPDLVLLPQDSIVKNLNKLSVVPYTSFSQRDFKDTYLQEGELFLLPEGIVALPFLLDPIVMYWNQDLFTNAGIVTPPSTWKQFYDLAPRVTVRDQGGNISRSLVSFGTYQNVNHAKEILSLLIMQAGNPIVSNQGGAPVVTLVPPNQSGTENPTASAIRFFTEFSKQDKGSYSWNSSLPPSRTMFELGDLAIYFGYASEYASIREKNPHLNFDIAVTPQIENTSARITFGQMQGISIVRATKNPQGAMMGAFALSDQSVVDAVATLTGLPPVRRDLVSARPSDPIRSVFYDSAIISRAWYDPSASDTNMLFANMIDDINSGKLNITQALSNAQNSFARLAQ